jgi:hypothetical protein
MDTIVYCKVNWVNTIRYYTTLYDTIQDYTILYDTIPRYTTLYNTIQHYTIPYVGSIEVSVLAHVALRMFAAIFLASQWHFLANKHAVLAGCSDFWPWYFCIKNEDTLHRWVALLLLIFILWRYYTRLYDTNTIQHYIYHTMQDYTTLYNTIRHYIQYYTTLCHVV